MPVRFHPPQGATVVVRFDGAFKQPEMVKPRLCVVLSPQMKARPGLCTVVPLSTTAPPKPMPFHCRLQIPFELPARWGDQKRWVKGDMIYAAGLHRTELLRLGTNQTGERVYQTQALPEDMFRAVQRCVLHGLGMSSSAVELWRSIESGWR